MSASTAPASSAAKKSAHSDVVVDVENLEARYGDRVILDDVNMQVRAGEIMVVMGGSGSGKSTLLRCLLALNRPARGRVALFGEQLENLSTRQLYAMRQRIGVAFQGGALFNSVSVEDNVIFPLREHTRLDNNTMRIMARMKLEVVGLAGAEQLKPSELSGGMIKRAALARALIMDPALLFFDEPSAGLDPVVSAGLDELILRLRDTTGVTVIVVTHELDSAFRIADRITVLDRGKVLISDQKETVRNSSNERVQNLLNRRIEEVRVNADEYLRRLTNDLKGL